MATPPLLALLLSFVAQGGRREWGPRGGCDDTLGAGARPWPPPAGPPHSPLTHLAVEARVALGAGTLVGPVTVLAGAPVQAGPRVALVDIVLAVAAREARRTQAGEGVDAVHTGAPIEAGAGGEQAAAGKGERGCGNPPGSCSLDSDSGGQGPDSQSRWDIVWLTSEPGTSGPPATHFRCLPYKPS